MDMHLMIFSITKDKVTSIIKFKVTKEDDYDYKLKCKLFYDFSFMVPSDFDDSEDMADERFWCKHLFFVFSEDPINHKESDPNDIILPDI